MQAAGGDAKEIERLEQELAREKVEAAEAMATAAKERAEAEEAKKLAAAKSQAAATAKAAAAPAPAPAPARKQGSLIRRIGLPSAAIVALVAAYWLRVGVRLARYFATGR